MQRLLARRECLSSIYNKRLAPVYRLRVLDPASWIKKPAKSTMNPCSSTSRTSAAQHILYISLICIRGPDEGQVQRAKVLTEDLLDVVRQEHAKMKTVLAQQQMELHQAQVQYAAYSAYAVCICSHGLRCVPCSRPSTTILSLPLCSPPRLGIAFISVCIFWCLTADMVLSSLLAMMT